MQTKSFVVATALVLALAIAAPTIGATSNKGSVADRALEVANEARNIAKTAKRAANKARGRANAALSTATAASNAAGAAAAKADKAVETAKDSAAKADAASSAAAGAAATANATAAELAANKAKSATLNGTVISSNDTSYEDLGGPSVSITVPASGLIEVWAQAEILDGAVSLFEDGQQVPGQDPNELCSGGGTPPPADALLAEFAGGPPTMLSTPGSFSPAGCGGLSAPGSVLFKTSPGPHTYSLRYAWCSCGTQGEFSNRFLAVAPRP